MKENLFYRNQKPDGMPSWRRRLVLALFVALPLCLQAQTITFSQSKVSIKTAIENIRKQTNYSVDFPGNLIDLSRNINVKKEGNALHDILDKIAGQELTYVFNGRHIVVSKKKVDGQSAPARHQQNKGGPSHHLKGVVTDAVTGELLIGATVRVDDDGKGATTDQNGEFEISDITPDDELQVSYIGYKTRKVQAGDVAVMNIKLSAADDQIGEVVVVGAGTHQGQQLICTQFKPDEQPRRQDGRYHLESNERRARRKEPVLHPWNIHLWRTNRAPYPARRHRNIV